MDRRIAAAWFGFLLAGGLGAAGETLTVRPSPAPGRTVSFRKLPTRATRDDQAAHSVEHQLRFLLGVPAAERRRGRASELRRSLLRGDHEPLPPLGRRVRCTADGLRNRSRPALVRPPAKRARM